MKLALFERAFAVVGSLSTGATGARMNLSATAARRITLPSVREQEEIVARIENETRRIDALMARIDNGIDRLKEYRTALISAAVTGKIDVRGEAGD